MFRPGPRFAKNREPVRARITGSGRPAGRTRRPGPAAAL